jgi:hypothetical protein
MHLIEVQEAKALEEEMAVQHTVQIPIPCAINVMSSATGLEIAQSMEIKFTWKFMQPDWKPTQEYK